MRDLLLSLFVIVLPMLSLGQDWKYIDADSPVLKGLQTELGAIGSITGDIRQEKSFSFLSEKLVSTGKFYYQKDNRLRWELDKPIDYTILIDGTSMRLREKGEEKQYKGMDRILRQVKEIILGCIDGSIIENRDYRPEFAESSDAIRIQMKPKNRKLAEFIKQIEVQFSKESAVLTQVSLTDPSGDRTDLKFSHVMTNIAIDENTFTDL